MTTFKHLFLIIFFSSLFCACSDNDKELSQDEFSSITDGHYFEIGSGSYFLKKEDNQWIEAEFPPDGHLVSINISNCFWFKGEKLYTDCVLKEYDGLWRKFFMGLQQKVIPLFVRSGFQYDPKTGELSTHKQTMSSEGKEAKYYVEAVSNEQLVIRIEYNKYLYDKVSGIRLYYNIYLAPDLNASIPFDPATQVFDSNEEAIDYVKQVIGEK